MGKKKNWPLWIGLFFVCLLLCIAVLGPIIAPYDLKYNAGVHTEVVNGTSTLIAPPIEPFKDARYIFGTDRWGYDLWTMLLYGAKYTIFTAVIVAMVKTAAGALLGFTMGLRAKQPLWWVTFEEIWGYLPGFLIIYFILLPITINPTVPPFQLTALFTGAAILIGIPSMTASIREKTIQLKTEAFMEASIVLGSSKARLMIKHIIPHFREELLMLFILEIVHTLTMMGQLALFNLFIGGTIYQPDSKLYISITKEWAGLIGQARPYLYWGEKYMLLIPLCFLLFAIVSFHILGIGVQKHFHQSYTKNSWY
ncbi:MAG TPA: ABC transporter permease subunit [Bacillus sp. (in: firmicutes)]|nr:ABC transporter permease subunit [Bacillus sp. (in: firmicutes)]